MASVGRMALDSYVRETAAAGEQRHGHGVQPVADRSVREPGAGPRVGALQNDPELEAGQHDVPVERVGAAVADGGVRGDDLADRPNVARLPQRAAHLHGLVPVGDAGHEPAEVDQRVANRGHLPVEHRSDPGLARVHQQVAEVKVAVHQPGRLVRRLVAGQERRQFIHAGQRLTRVPGHAPVALPFRLPAGHLPAQEPVRAPEVRQPHGNVVDAPDPRQLGGGFPAQLGPSGGGRGVGRQPHHRVDPIHRAHDHERDAEHGLVRARRGPARVRHVGAGQRLEYPRLAQDYLSSPRPRVPRRTAQHVARAGPAEPDQQVLRASLELDQVLDRPGREALRIKPARQRADIDQVDQRSTTKRQGWSQAPEDISFTVTSPEGERMYARQHALEHPGQPAIIMGTSGESVTFAEYEARCNQIAHLLRSAGLQRGDHIAVFMENSIPMLEIEGAAERTGLYYTLINSYLAPDEVAYIITNSSSRLLFSSAAKREVAEQAAAKCPQLERMLMTGPDVPPDGWESFDDAVAGFPGDPVPDESLGAAMLYSSGTTGQPKGVLRDLPTVAPSEPLPVMLFVRAMFGFRDGMTYLNPAPLYHSAPQASVAASLRMGCTTVGMEHVDAEQWLVLVDQHQVTNCQMVPVMFSRLLRLPEETRARYDTSSLECIVHAAAPCPVHAKKAMIAWLGPVITEYYGATEANGFTFCDSAQWLAHPGTVGRAILGELLILDDEGRQRPVGMDGTIWFRGATAFEYFQDPAKTEQGRTSDGTTSTVGDVA